MVPQQMHETGRTMRVAVYARVSTRDGEQDPVSQWFEAEHSFGSFRGRGSEFIEVIVDKLES